MNWQEQIYLYCERGHNPAFWAEPLNALTNAAFIAAGLLALREVKPGPAGKRQFAERALIGLVLVIGIGSFLFHTFATRWAQMADVVPIGVFMLAYLAYVLRRFAWFSWVVVLAGLGVFYAVMQYVGSIRCPPGLMPITAAAGARCLNGSLAYSPALFTLAASAGLLAFLRHPAWRTLAVASLVFSISLTVRTFDLEICSQTQIAGRAAGVHFVWHMLNAVTVYLLLVAALRHGGGVERQPV